MCQLKRIKRQIMDSAAIDFVGSIIDARYYFYIIFLFNYFYIMFSQT